MFFLVMVKRWGRIGVKRPRMIRKVFENYIELRKDFKRTVMVRFAHGYRLMREG